jgi:hypothetical protein
MSEYNWQITAWNPGDLPVELFVPHRRLRTSSDGESCTLQWEDSEGPCSMTLTGRLPGLASGSIIEVKRSGRESLRVNVTAHSVLGQGKAALTGTLARAGKSSTPPGTFAATLDPN